MSSALTARSRRRTAGDEWRVQGDRPADISQLGPFDEIVVGRRAQEAWLHVEMLDDASAFVQIADRCFWVHVPAKGKPRITWEEERPWRPWKNCRKRPGGTRCRLRADHDGGCVP